MATNKELEKRLKAEKAAHEEMAKQLAEMQEKLNKYEPVPGPSSLMDDIKGIEEDTIEAIKAAIDSCENRTGRKLLEQVRNRRHERKAVELGEEIHKDLATMIEKVQHAKKVKGQCSLTRLTTDLGEIANTGAYSFSNFNEFKGWVVNNMRRGWESSSDLL